MEGQQSTMTELYSNRWLSDAGKYWYDGFQRSVLFMDVLRKRGNIYFKHLEEGQPPVLKFDYEVIMDGRLFERPVNYKLARILPPEGVVIDPEKRPVVIIDPRAGHGPGIGGAKRSSKIGMAMEMGHPVYFVLFDTDPVPGQTIPDVEKAEIKFIDEVVRRHPKARRPSVTGNCQAGWALAMLSADRPGVTGPIVFNGSPLSYWAGIEGKDTMRYMGGLLGGIWLTSFLCDLGNDKFDGANLVMNFEMLNPANTFWKKQYNVYANVDKEEERYLEFEKWWNGYFFMTSEEIHFIIDNLFVGNRLEQGGLKLDEKQLDLKNIKDPVVIFASNGDNITPPQQALNWVTRVWDTEDRLHRRQQVVAYMLHENIGHLGIFVSGKVAEKEHKEIISSYDMIEYLPPGIYEMLIEGDPKTFKPGETYEVRFVKRSIEHILSLDDGTEDEEGFPLVAAVSAKNDWFYRTFISPFIKPWITETTAECFRQLHPMRTTRYMFSDLNPFMIPFQYLAPAVKQHRQMVNHDNYWLEWEKLVSNGITDTLDYCKKVQDQTSELLFNYVYGNEWLKTLFPESSDENKLELEAEMKRQQEERRKLDLEHWYSMMDKGGFAEGLIRVISAIAGADSRFERDEFLKIQQITKVHKWLKDIEIPEYRRIAREQNRLLQVDSELALQSLAKLLPTEEERTEVIKIAEAVFQNNVLADETKALIKKLRRASKETLTVKKNNDTEQLEAAPAA